MRRPTRSETSDLLAIGSNAGTVTLWRIGRRNATRVGTPLVSGGGDVASIAFDRSGATLAVGSQRGVVSFTVERVAFTPDAGWLVAAGASGIVRLKSVLWTDDAGRLRSHACGLVARNLTISEWHQFFPGRRYRTSCPTTSSAAG